MPVPIYWFGGLFGSLSNWTAAVAGYLWDASYWYDYVTDRIADVISLDSIYNYFRDYFAYAVYAFNWVTNALNNVTSIITFWWSYTQYTVKNWITAATQGFSELRVAWDTFWTITFPSWITELQRIDAALNNFFLVTLPTLFDIKYADEWWNSKFSDVLTIVSTAFTEREGFWAGWQDWRDKVTEFFTDPEEWLYKAFDRIIERFW